MDKGRRTRTEECREGELCVLIVIVMSVETGGASEGLWPIGREIIDVVVYLVAGGLRVTVGIRRAGLSGEVGTDDVEVREQCLRPKLPVIYVREACITYDLRIV